MATARIPISSLIQNPFVRAAFERAERDEDGMGVSLPMKPVLVGGAGAIVDKVLNRAELLALTA